MFLSWWCSSHSIEAKCTLDPLSSLRTLKCMLVPVCRCDRRCDCDGGMSAPLCHGHPWISRYVSTRCVLLEHEFIWCLPLFACMRGCAECNCNWYSSRYTCSSSRRLYFSCYRHSVQLISADRSQLSLCDRDLRHITINALVESASHASTTLLQVLLL